jgi:phosphatidylserine/phosphatidylglycerophosphate/cardiolipin synthase-like enzyme/uncharacterized membrane protein YdjX (TVP38/TMEM64 family)
MGRILEPGRTCWRVERADRLAFVVDVADYFDAVADAIEQAERSVLIVGWDVHSRVKLRPERDDTELGELLDRVTQRRPDLHVRLLVWDYALLFALERELLSELRFRLQTSARVTFRFASDHPVGASHHQKIVVVDDALAFAGGIDLTIARWDRRAHAPHESARVMPGGEPYGPFHDVQMAVTGPAARALGELARERWRAATGERLEPPRAAAAIWPEALDVHLQGADVGIARTMPAYENRAPAREVEQLYLASIERAKRTIYVENQYLTAEPIRDALAERLRDEDGPEVVIVTPRDQSGRLEEITMGAVRSGLVHQLRSADGHDRLRVLYPAVGEGEAVNVHAKVMVVDDELVRVGSSNLSNRSMALDSECDLAVEAAGDPAKRRVIATFMRSLLAEHLDALEEEVKEAIEERGGLVPAVDALRCDEGRTLRPLATHPDAETARSARVLADPDRPVTEALAEFALPGDELRTDARSRLPKVLVTVAALLALAAVWAWTPLGAWVKPERLAGLAAPLRTTWVGPIAGAVAIAVLTLVMVPVTALIVMASVLFGPWIGAGTALVGSLLSAMSGYGLGRLVLRDTVRQWAGERFSRLRTALHDRGVLAVVAVRLVPVAPYTIVNMVAGSSHVSFRDFVIGSFLGMVPGVVALTVAADRVAAAAKSPHWSTVAIAALVVLVLILGFEGLRRWLGPTVTAHDSE